VTLKNRQYRQGIFAVKFAKESWLRLSMKSIRSNLGGREILGAVNRDGIHPESSRGQIAARPTTITPALSTTMGWHLER
jgi:hypothetical protein